MEKNGMSFRERIARMIAPNMHSTEEMRELVKEEIQRAKMNLPITANYDPKGEGYRPLMGDSGHRRTIMTIDRQRMFEVAYYMWDMSAMFKRLARMDRTFIFGESFEIHSDNDNVQEILDRFVENNKIKQRFPDRMMWMSILGEQCYPAFINPVNGDVALFYADPTNVAEVYTLAYDVETISQVELRGSMDMPAKKIPAVRRDLDFKSKSFGRLVGEA